ncbi:Ig-like domain-containing protein, partial [Clostridium sp. HCS.1]|uniref:Ig-like domain-containing protein n=1 Tax=Clostridium sp. HCS.1 TaxID=3238594 RepID=UPI003A0FC5EF
YIVKGDLALVGEIVNPDKKQAEIAVTVKEKMQEAQGDKKIQSVKELQGITASYGTSFEKLQLRQTVEVTLEDGTKDSLNITWNPETYDGQTAGTY